MHYLKLEKTPWKFREIGGVDWLPASVPGCVHRDLCNNQKIPDPFWGTNELDLQWIGWKDWEYRTEFDLSQAMLDEENIELVSEGLDTLASVYLNDTLVAKTKNMFEAYRWEVKPLLKAKGNVLRIVFASAEKYVREAYPSHHPMETNDPVGRCTVIRKQQCQFGWDWGPRFVSAGIWRDIRLEAWSSARIEGLHLSQKHGSDGAVALAGKVELAGAAGDIGCKAVLSYEGSVVSELSFEGGSFEMDIPTPKLWWPAGQGAQPLYTIELTLVDGGSLRELDRYSRRIGLRTIELDRHADEWGESFQFVVNGRPVFAKGANWIPAHSFVAGLRRADYERDLRAAVDAHMNMLRVWGGGIYESEDFYDLCDELGLMVWQDFMFACTMYPSTEAAFLEDARGEARWQVRRLRHRACLALWCGNNEMAQINKAELNVPALRVGYENLFHELLPGVVAQEDGITGYWPSSEWRGFFDSENADGEKSGDTHFWDVWHRNAPVSDYARWDFRFVSEFGMQSFPSPKTQAAFCDRRDGNIFGPVMENHQKHKRGNQLILEYISQRYRYPKDQDSLVYLSQLNQAWAMQFGIEHYRRISPRCMGTLYWQLNDCWPVASWSSIEFGGEWRALHYAAKRFFSPTLVSAKIIDAEATTIGNYRKKASGKIHLYTVHDAPQEQSGSLHWQLRSLGGELLLEGEKAVTLEYGKGVVQQELDLSGQMAELGVDELYLRSFVCVEGEIVSDSVTFLTAPRFMNFRPAKTEVSVRNLDAETCEITFVSDVYQHAFMFELSGLDAKMDDNYFDLLPGLRKTVSVRMSRACSSGEIKAALRHRSLVDSILIPDENEDHHENPSHTGDPMPELCRA